MCGWLLDEHSSNNIASYETKRLYGEPDRWGREIYYVKKTKNDD